jgi:hypothetical protein
MKNKDYLNENKKEKLFLTYLFSSAKNHVLSQVRVLVVVVRTWI